MPDDIRSDREDVLVILSAIGTTIAAVAAVKVDHNLATLATAGGALLTSLLGYWKARKADANARAVARIGADATLDTNARTVLVQTVTSERAIWRREIRSAAAELGTILRQFEFESHHEWARVNRLASEIRLRLNPEGRKLESATGKHARDYAVHIAIDTVACIDRKTAGNLSEAADALERAVANLLKQEWTKSKREAVTGRLEESDLALSEELSDDIAAEMA